MPSYPDPGLVDGFVRAYRHRYGPMTRADAVVVFARFRSWHTLAEATAMNDARAARRAGA